MSKLLSFSILFACFTAVSCSSKKYLPKPREIGYNPYGSHIKAYVRNLPHKGSKPNIKGELIAVSDSSVFVLIRANNQCIEFPKKDLIDYTLTYAKPPSRYLWTIPVYTASTISHGVLLVFTAPVNLIYTLAVVNSANQAYQYTAEDIPLTSLHSFARFPQGIPKHIKPDQIKQVNNRPPIW